MRIAVISGSHRPKSESGKIARYCEATLTSLGHEVFLLDLARNPLPLWDEGIWSQEPTITGKWKPLSQELAKSDGAVVIAPEWGGMVPAALKNFFLFATDGCLYHKPGLIVGVSSTRNGAYPVAELRMSSYKNTHLQYISEHVIVRNAPHVLNDGESVSDEDAFTRKRMTYGLNVLLEYSKALRLVRDSGVLNRKEFTNGM